MNLLTREEHKNRQNVQREKRQNNTIGGSNRVHGNRIYPSQADLLTRRRSI